MGFLPDLAKATTVQNESKVGLGNENFSNAYQGGANQSLDAALGANQQFKDNLGSQQALAQQYQNTINGVGANPAQAMLANQTGQAIQNQGALLGSARGASVNPALLARQVGMQGAGMNQQMVGQAALMQAQQSLGAQQALGGLYGQMGNQIIGGQNANSGLFNIAANAQNAQNAQQIAIQNSNAAIEQANANTAQGALSGLASGTGAAAAGLAPSASGGGKSAGGGGGGEGGAASGASAGGAIGMGMAMGGEVPLMPMQAPQPLQVNPNGPKSQAGQWLAGPQLTPMSPVGGDTTSVLSTPQGGAPKDSPGKSFIPGMGMMMSQGALVPGHAKVKGNSPANDVVPAVLSPGEIVVPRSHAQDPEKAAAFARAVAMRARKGKK